MDQVPHGSNLERSGSSVSLESVQNRLDALPRVIADSQLLNDSSDYRHFRLRSNSWQDRVSLGSENSTESGSISGSVERLQMPNLSHQIPPMQHVRSKSEEAEQQQIDVNVNRSISDCTGTRKSFRVPFERMVPGRRSVRQNKFHPKFNPTQLGGFSPSANRRESQLTLKPQQTGPHQAMTSVDLELELQAAYSKQVRPVL